MGLTTEKLTAEQHAEAMELLSAMPQLLKTELAERVLRFEADDFDLETLRMVAKQLRWRAEGRPGLPEDLREEMVKADVEREAHEARAFEEGWIPGWLVPSHPGVMVFQDGSSNPDLGELKDAPRDPRMVRDEDDYEDPAEVARRFLRRTGA